MSLKTFFSKLTDYETKISQDEKEKIKSNLKEEFIMGLIRGHSLLIEAAYGRKQDIENDFDKEF